MTNHLRAVDVVGGVVRVAGIVDLEPTDGGTVLHRIPAWARRQHNDLALSLMETMPSGARLQFVTDATCIELDVDLTLLQMGTEAVRPAAFDLVVDGDVVSEQATSVGTVILVDPLTGAVDFRAGGPTMVRFDDLPAVEKQVEVWLPQGAAVRLIELRADGEVSPPAVQKKRWVHDGSSISHCFEATRPTGTWPAVAARLAGVDLQSFAFAGQCQLDPFIGRMIAAERADLISLKLGINVVNADTMRERTYVPAVHGLLDSIREQHRETPIVLITPITCPMAEGRPGPTVPAAGGGYRVVDRPAALAVGSLDLRRIRQLEAEIVAARQAAGDVNLHLLEGTDLFGPADVGDLPDGLHPNSDGYRRMGERFHEMAFLRGPFSR